VKRCPHCGANLGRDDGLDIGGPLDQFIEDFSERVASAMARQQERTRQGMIDQANSPLGPRRHCAAVRARMNRNDPGAALVGRKHLLTPEALAEELGRASSRKAAPEAPPPAVKPGSVADELRRELAALPRQATVKRAPRKRGAL
jgi:hypothetical protein